jgi:hypothetical protein
VVSEPRQAFEDIVSLILKCLHPNSRRVRVHRGDGGIDSFTGTLGESGEADVFQVKHFVSIWGNSQKQQIREAYETARTSKEYRLGKWTLCVPSRLAKEDLRWFDEWRGKQDRQIELMDGDDLTAHLSGGRSSAAREKLRDWGVIGLQAGGPRFSAMAVIQKRIPAKTGLVAVVFLCLKNTGDRSARGLKATIAYSEIGCACYQQFDDWLEARTDGLLNPKEVRYRHTMHPGEHSQIMGIPLCERSTMPFTVSIQLEAEDSPPSLLRCRISEEQIHVSQSIPFE